MILQLKWKNKMAYSKEEMIECLAYSLNDPTTPRESKIYILKSAWNMGIVDFKERKRLYEKYIDGAKQYNVFFKYLKACEG